MLENSSIFTSFDKFDKIKHCKLDYNEPHFKIKDVEEIAAPDIIIETP